MEKVRVVLIDDQTLVRQGIRMMLEGDEQITVVGDAATGDQGLSLAATWNPHVVITEMELPGMDGTELTRRLRQQQPETEVMVLSSKGKEYFDRAMKAGASGYLLKTTTREQLISAVKAVCQGQSPIDPTLSRLLLNGFAHPSHAHHLPDLSPREMDILRLIASGTTTGQMAAHLFVSNRTVTRELRNIYDKLGANDRAHAVSQAYKRGLI